MKDNLSTNKKCGCRISNLGLKTGDIVRMKFGGACGKCGIHTVIENLHAVYLYDFDDGSSLKHIFKNYSNVRCESCGNVPANFEVYCGGSQALRAVELEAFINKKNERAEK